MKYGRKNHVNLNPLFYNICLLGESKIGKTTLVKQVCEKLVGDDGYLFLELGMERGADAIEGINYVNCPEWDMPYDELTNSIGFADIVDDILENKDTDYPNLQVVVWDTYDQLIGMAEKKSIALSNRANPDKKVNTINAAWGGFGRGEKKALELMMEKMDALRRIGIATFFIGHVKTKDITDVVTGETYQTLTSDQQQNYFNPLKKVLHFLGLAYIDRQIVREKTGRKDQRTNQEITVGHVQSEERRIKFRDDTYCVDSGGRFADIVSDIPLNADAFIQALNDAILKEQAKSDQSLEERKKEQAEADAKFEKRVEETIAHNKAEAKITPIIQECMEIIKTKYRGQSDVLGNIMKICTDAGFKNPTEVDDLRVAQQIKEYLDSLA